MIYWFYLMVAIVFEVAGTLSLKFSTQNSNLLVTVFVIVFYITSFTFMWLAMKKIEMGVAYAVWAGAGTAIIALLGWLIFKDSMTLMKLVFISLIIIGVVGLKLATPSH
ncbi:multidrug efflux SMR transporter [Thiomicrorhabdus sp. ZW0627]|uniref:DMT family transporter n=1 Tax=Thiomicrorhabdus sp. ZW0627 TaxID=3039774 RepID=UPI002436E603|nr:multidrug efflux SMR transporter [Thiomicrorhabdus sp. ZW0627]MDG6773442.1 multidrug efflux SMR transporter [Thiomicrorhabdus sp. ZW0627]